MKSRILFIVLILSLGLNTGVVGTIGYHWLRHQGWVKHQHGFKDHMREKLNLTDEQVNAMEKERQELETSLVPIKDAIHAKRTELMSLLDTENAYSPKIDVLIGEIGQLQMEMEKNVTRHSFTTKKILSPEQQKQFHAMLRHGFQKKHPGPRGKMPFGNPSPF